MKTDVFGSLQHDKSFIPDGKSTLDANAKRILKYREVLARILKYAVPDFMNDDISDLVERIAKDPGNSDYAQITDIECDHSGMVSIKFDLRTSATTSAGCEVIIDVEPQNKYRPSVKGSTRTYSLAQRGMYYISRLIAGQLGVNNLRYNTLKKCYSIWLIFDTSISEPQVLDYKMTEQSGKVTTVSQRLSEEIDLAELIFITMDKNLTSTQDIFRFLNALFLNKVELSEFIPVTESTQTIYKEVYSMCDIGKWRYNQGIEQGIEQGEEKAIFSFLDHIIKPGMTANDIVTILCQSFGLSREDAQRYYEKYHTLSS